MKPPYKGASNAWYTQALFWEMARTITIEDRAIDPIFSLYTDRPGLINCQRTFVELNDPTGYQWAVKYLDSWPHFQRLLQTQWFKEAFDVWNQELQMKTKSEALVKIKELSNGEDPKALAAAKYLANEEWTKKAGRPSKQQLDRELKQQAKLLEETADDMQRIGLRIVK